jgi:hypothetical protein
MNSHYEMIASPHFELVQSPHIEFNPGAPPGMAQLHAQVFAPGWAPFTFPGPGWPWTGIPVGVLTYTTINFSATSGGASLNVVMNLDRRNAYPLGDALTSPTPFSNPSVDVINLNVLYGLLSNSLGSGTYTVTPTSVTYSQAGLGTASINLFAPFTLFDLSNNAHELFGAINIQAVPTAQWWDVFYAPGPSTAFGQIFGGQILVPQLFQTSGNVYYWGWGLPSQSLIIPPQSIPTPFTHIAPLPPTHSINATVPDPVFRNIVAQSSYTGGEWDMYKAIWRKPGQSSVGLEQDFYATNPGPPSQPTPTALVLPCDPNGIFILTPIGTPIDIPVDVNNNNYEGARFPNFLP